MKKKLGGFNPANINNANLKYKKKALKLKRDLVFKAKVKTYFYKHDSNATEDTPEFYKQIFNTEDTKPEEQKPKEPKAPKSEGKKREKVKKTNPMARSLAIVERQNKERTELLETIEKEKQERQEQYQKQQEKRSRINKLMKKKTNKGQIKMGARIECLLDKIRQE